MENEIQLLDRQKLKSFIARNSLVSVMNNTKWDRLRSLMLDESGKLPSWKVKELMSEYNEESRWEPDWRYHLPGYRHIEWLDINPRKMERRGQLLRDKVTDHSEYFIRLLKENNIPFSIEADNIRIWGYVWPNTPVNFV